MTVTQLDLSVRNVKNMVVIASANLTLSADSAISAHQELTVSHPTVVSLVTVTVLDPRTTNVIS